MDEPNGGSSNNTENHDSNESNRDATPPPPSIPPSPVMTMPLQSQQQQQQQQTIVHVRDRLFHALFYRIAIMYARKFPKTLRRLLEFFVLILALGSFGLLSYLHVVFNRNPINCLAPIQDKWPRDGILRVEIVHNTSTFFIMSHDNTSYSYSLKDSYEKEYSNSMLDLFSSYLNNPENEGGGDSFKSKNLFSDFESTFYDPNGAYLSDRSEWKFDPVNYFKRVTKRNKNYEEEEDRKVNDAKIVEKNNHDYLSNHIEIDLIKKQDNIEQTEENPSSTRANNIETISPAYKLLKEAFNELQLFSKVFEDNYIIEYSLEYGFLRLSPQTRQKLNITVMLVTLDPNRDECFGTGFNKFVLDEFLGYNEILMLSIKNIAEKEKNKGFVRNAISGEHFRFVSSWMARSSYVAALLIMILFVINIFI
jgi:hypothetical protein